MRAPDLSGMLPLHHAALNRAPPAVARVLLRAYPRAASEPANDGWLPLALASIYGAPHGASPDPNRYTHAPRRGDAMHRTAGCVSRGGGAAARGGPFGGGGA